MIVSLLEQEADVQQTSLRWYVKKVLSKNAIGVEVISDAILAKGVAEAANIHLTIQRKFLSRFGQKYFNLNYLLELYS